MQSCCFANLRPCPRVSVFIWKRNFLFTDTTSVHTYAMKTINENGTFRKRFPGNFLKTLFSRVRVDRRKRNFSKTLRTHYQFQSSPRNFRNLFKLADGRFPFLSFRVFSLTFSLTWPASMQIYWNKRNRLHKKGVQLPEDWFGTLTWPPFHFVLGHQYGRRDVMWKHFILGLIVCFQANLALLILQAVYSRINPGDGRTLSG